MKRNQGSEDLDSEKKPLLQSLHLPNVFGSSLKGETTAYLLSMYVRFSLFRPISSNNRELVLFIYQRDGIVGHDLT